MEKSKFDKELSKTYTYVCDACDEKKVTELCPFCEREVELQSKFEIQHCPHCNKPIKPCSLCNCDICDCANCSLI